ncbi:hypothetical protein AB0D94_02925 [Streptomyces sp. NPDC048255]|uniref:hypothetical protein n=1 Tax=Streptomyces sp. NPDC048255 TaxID=3154713 RepID=UPI0033DD3CEB
MEPPRFRPVVYEPAPADGPAPDPAAPRLSRQPHWLEEPQWTYSEATDTAMDSSGSSGWSGRVSRRAWHM